MELRSIDLSTRRYDTSVLHTMRDHEHTCTQLSYLAPEGGYARLAHTTQYIERETPPTATSTSAESNI